MEDDFAKQFYSHLLMQTIDDEDIFFTRLSCNCAADASKLLEYIDNRIPLYDIDVDAVNGLKSSITHWCVTRH